MEIVRDAVRFRECEAALRNATCSVGKTAGKKKKINKLPSVCLTIAR